MSLSIGRNVTVENTVLVNKIRKLTENVMLFRAIDHHIPQRTLKRRSRPPWIDNEIMKLIRKKKKLWKRLKTNGSADLFLKFKDLRRKTKKLIVTKNCIA